MDNSLKTLMQFFGCLFLGTIVLMIPLSIMIKRYKYLKRDKKPNLYIVKSE